MKTDEEKILKAEAKRLDEVDKVTDEYLRKLKKVYEKAKKEIDIEIAKFYAEYPNMSYEEVNKLLKPVELKRFHVAVKTAYKKSKANGYSKKFALFCKHLDDKMRITRLEKLRLEIYERIQIIYAVQHDQMQEKMKTIYQYQYQRSAYDDATATGIAVRLGTIDETMLRKAVNEDWLESNFAKRNNVNNDRIINALNSIIPQAFVLGKNPQEFAKDISVKLNISYSNAERLARTEFIHIATSARFDQMRNSELFDEYQYIATLDSKTSEVCQELNNKVFTMREYKQGVTAPPMHPYCRSTIIPYFEDEQAYGRIAKDSTGRYIHIRGDISFEEYKKQYLT